MYARVNLKEFLSRELGIFADLYSNGTNDSSRLFNEMQLALASNDSPANQPSIAGEYMASFNTRCEQVWEKARTELLQQWVDAGEVRSREARNEREPRKHLVDLILEANKTIEGYRDYILIHKLSLEWLRLKYGLKVGDTIVVHAWVQPRTIVIEDFELSFSYPDEDTNESHGFLVFSGPCLHPNKNKKATSHGAGMHDYIVKLKSVE